MKKPPVLFLILILVVLAGLMFPFPAKTQIVNETAKKRFTIGIGLFEDIWFNSPKGIKPRTINQGFQTFVMYNIPFGKSRFAFSIGLGFRANNLYGDFLVKSTYDSTWFQRIGDTIDYKRSKLTLPFLELPLEIKFTSRSKIAIGIGFKVAYLLPAHSKYVGEDYILNNGDKLRVKYRDIKNLEEFSYGPTFRMGYRWFHINAYYSLNNIITKGNGPQMNNLSIGILLMPF